MGPRAAQLSLTLSGYLTILLRNHLLGSFAPIELSEDVTTAQVRERVPFSVNKDLWSEAEKAAGRLGGTASQLVEALAMAEILSPAPDLLIRARGPKPKLR